ncbi:MAG: ArsC family reductase [Burkholderiales bacterium]
MIVYGIRNCDTVKKARAWLDTNNIAYEFHDYKTAGIDEKHLRAWLKQIDWQQLVNRSGMTWRKLSGEQRAKIIDDDSAIALMLAQTSVIKRPLVEIGGKIALLGYSADEYSNCLKNKQR